MEKFDLLQYLGIKSLKGIDIGIALVGYMVCHYLVHRHVKGPRMWPLVGMLPSVIYHGNHVYDWLTETLIRCGGTFKFKGPWMTNLFCVVTGDPVNVAHILKLRFSNFPKGDYFRTLAHDFLGNGIFNADDETWRQQRRTANIEFNSTAFRNFMVQSVQELVHGRLVPVLEDACRSARAIDLHDVLLRFTFDNVCIVALGADAGCLRVGLPDIAFAKAFEEATAATMFRFLTPTAVWKIMKYLDVGPERRLRLSLATIDEFAAEAIVARKKEVALVTASRPLAHSIRPLADPSRPLAEPNRTGADLLSTFMQLKEEDGCTPRFSDTMLRDISVNFILAGRDTSSMALSWFFWLIIQHPEVEDEILSEMQWVLRKSSSRPGYNTGSTEKVITYFTVEELKQMHYLQAALSESLRLYPSVPIDHKEVDSDDCFPDGTYLKKGTKVLYAIYSMGRMESIWGKDCLEFKPERWLKGGVFVSESAYKYPVFNGGPRLCLGKDFAYLQMKWIAATLIWGFRLKMAVGHVVEPRLALTLYMKNGLLVTLQPRHV
eukprot:Gb_01453 [translate_table: standard]